MKKIRKYKLLDHLSDTFIESYGKTREEAFENAALALVDTMVRIEKIHLKIEDFWCPENSKNFHDYVFSR